LSTGLRINSAKDDAAGLAISNRMTAQIRGMSMAIKNANDGISMAQTADGAYGQVTSMLQRMRELAVQAANGAVSGSDRESIQLEIEELKAEINNVAERTNFNGIKLLDGSAQDIKLQTGTNEGELMSVGFGSAKTTEIGSGDVPALTSLGREAATLTSPSALDLTINGVAVGASLAEDDTLSTTGNTGSAIAIAAAINRVSDESGVYAKVNETVVLGSAMTAADDDGTVTINGYSTSIIYTTTDAEVSRQAVVAAINDISDATGVTAINTGDDSRGVVLVAADGRNIRLETTLTAPVSGLKSATATTYSGTFSLYSVDGGPISIDEQVGGNVQNSGLRQGVYESRQAQTTTFERAAAVTAASTSTTGVLNSSTLVINGFNISKAVSTDDDASYVATAATGSQKAASAIAIAVAINKSSELTGVVAKADANVIRGDGTFTENSSTAGVVRINGVNISGIAGDRDSVIDSINQFEGQTGVRAEAWGAGLQLVADDGRNISISLDADISAAELGLGGQTIVATSATEATVFYSTVSLTSDRAFEVRRGSEGDGNFEKLGFREGTFGGKHTGVKIAEIDVTTQLGAGIAITAIDNAIDDISSAQARSGAFQNRLDAAVSVLSESSENASAARSRIMDTDYATETTALAKAQIVQQAATAMLAQANQQSQSVLALLQ
jgi:flagellin